MTIFDKKKPFGFFDLKKVVKHNMRAAIVGIAAISAVIFSLSLMSVSSFELLGEGTSSVTGGALGKCDRSRIVDPLYPTTGHSLAPTFYFLNSLEIMNLLGMHNPLEILGTLS
jgi:hypothetical protein